MPKEQQIAVSGGHPNGHLSYTHTHTYLLSLTRTTTKVLLTAVVGMTVPLTATLITLFDK